MRTNKNGIKVSFVISITAILTFISAPLAKIYTAISGTSTLTYFLTHPLHQIEGVSKDFVCTVDLSPDTVSSQINVSAKISSFDTQNSSRDSHAMELVEALKYPTVELKSQRVRVIANGYEVEANLTFHGITRPITFFVRPKISGDQVEIAGKFTVKLSDFNVPKPTLLFISSEDEITIQFDLFSKLHN